MHPTRHRRRSAASAAPGIPAPVAPRPARVLPATDDRRQSNPPADRRLRTGPAVRVVAQAGAAEAGGAEAGAGDGSGLAATPDGRDDEAARRRWARTPGLGRRRPVRSRVAGRRRLAASDAGRRPGHDGGPAAGRSRGPADPGPGDAPGRQRQRAWRPVAHSATGPLRRPDQQSRPGGAAPGEPARRLGRGRRGRPPLPGHAQPDRLGRLPADHADPATAPSARGARAAAPAGHHGGFYHYGQNYILFSIRQPIELGHQTTHRYHIAKAAYEQQQWNVLQAELTDAGPDLPLLPDGRLSPRAVPAGPAARRLQRPARGVARRQLEAGQPKVTAADVALARVESRATRQRSRPPGRIT